MTARFDWQQDGDKHYRRLGRTGVRVPKLCLGAMNFGGPTPEDDSIRIIHAALDAGLNFIDTADVYSRGESERVVGKAIAGRRDEVFLATKVYNRMRDDDPNAQGLSRYHIMRACEDSLRRLGTDHIDLYQLHRHDPAIPIDETLRALDDLVRQGKVRYLGVSTFPAWKTVEAIHLAERWGLNRFVSEQPPYNLLDRRVENTIVPMCQQYGLAMLIWAPIGGGVLTGKYPVDGTEIAGARAVTLPAYKKRISLRAREFGAQFAQIAQEAGFTGAQLALLWAVEQPGVTSAIIGPRTLAHLESSLSILDLDLPDDVAARLDELNPPGTAVADFFNTAAWMKTYIPSD